MDVSQDFMPGKVLHPEGDDLDWNFMGYPLAFYCDRNVVLREQHESFRLPLVLSYSKI